MSDEYAKDPDEVLEPEVVVESRGDDDDYADPLDVLRDLMLTAESEQVRATCAAKLAEYKHVKKSEDETRVRQVQFDFTFIEESKPVSLPRKKV